MTLRKSETLLAPLLAITCLLSATAPSIAEKKYDIGASDTEIKIGNIMPYSGPASAYGVIGAAMTAYFKMINEAGGINGRKINFLSNDDAYSPPKTVEQARRLVESDGVLFIAGSFGTAGNGAIQKYMNQKHVPQLYVVSGASRFNDPKQFPWTMGLGATYKVETGIYARYILQEKPSAKIAVLYQNDDAGKELLKGLKLGLSDKAATMIVAESAYEVSEPTIDAHLVQLKYSGADVLLSLATPKFAAQSIKKTSELDWNPLHFLPVVSSSVGATLSPAGIQNSQHVISAAFLKDAMDAQWADDSGMRKYLEFLAKDMHGADKSDGLLAIGYTTAQAVELVLRRCGDDLTRENVMKQAASLDHVSLDLFLPGIEINTGPTDYDAIKDMQLMRFEGASWKLFGGLVREGSKE
jgi:ABC-type branched-subunit amino acid transport system substrate-binding protein